MPWQEMMSRLLVQFDITLSPEQTDVAFKTARLLLIGGGEGAGKSYLAAVYACARIITDIGLYAHREEPLLYWIVGADFEDARKEFDYLIEFMDILGLLDKTKSSIPTRKDQRSTAILSDGGRKLAVIDTVSGYDPLKIGREQPDGVLGCEISRWDKEVWDRIYGRLQRKRDTAWGFFSGSFESSLGWFAATFLLGLGPNEFDISSIKLPSWANLTIYPLGRNDPAILQLERQRSPAKFLERYGGEPSPPSDSVIPEFKPNLHISASRAEYDPSYETYLGVDPGGGTSPYSVLFVQFVGTEVHVVDEIYVLGWTHEQIVEAVVSRPAWRTIVKGPEHVMDIGGNQNHMGMRSAVEAWQESTGINFQSDKWSVADEIDRLRSTMAIDPITQLPRFYVHPRCKGFIHEMGGSAEGPIEGVGRWRVKNGRAEPRNNHSATALAYLLLYHFGTKHIYGAKGTTVREPVSYLQNPFTPERTDGSKLLISGRTPVGQYMRNTI